MNLKQKIYTHYKQLANDKISMLTTALEDLRQSSINETKSSAGDKFETTRAMIHAEQERIGRQLKEAMDQKTNLDTINIFTDSSKITKGSLVKTNKGYLFVSIALGKINLDGVQVIALSPQSPLGYRLMGLKENDIAEVNGTRYSIEKVD